MPSNVKPMPSDDQSVPSDASEVHVEAGGKKRSERLRARRDEAGLAQVSGWVPKDRRSYARDVLAALAQGANSLPPDPEQAEALRATQATLEAAQVEAMTAKRAEAVASEALLAAQAREEVLAAELDVARAEIEVALDAKRQAETSALAQVQAAKIEAALAQATAERFQKAPGLRGRVIRWLAPVGLA